MRPVRGMKIVAVAAGRRTYIGHAAACGDAPTDDADHRTRRPARTRPAWSPTAVASTTSRSTRRPGRACRTRRRSSTHVRRVKNVASKAEADYEPNLTSFVSQKCNFILAVGGLMGDATDEGREGEPEPAVRDRRRRSRPTPTSTRCSSTPPQAAFLAGYLAAGYSKTGKVGTYGGLKIPPVTIFMDGFADGVAALQHRSRARTSRCSAGTRPSRTAVRRRLRRPGQGQGQSATRSSPRAPT